MKTTILALIVALLFASCSKSNLSTGTPVAQVAKDSTS
jgi:hypothetical protein